MNIRERKQAEREERIAERERAAGGADRLTRACAPSLDALVAPGAGVWKAPEPPVGHLIAPEGKGE